MKQERLDAEFDGGEQSGNVDGDITGQSGRNHPTICGEARPGSHHAVDGVGNQRSDYCHIETISAESADSAVAEE